MNSCLIEGKVIHERFVPKKYKFGASFFWFKIDLDEIGHIEEKIPFFKHNKFSLYSFYDEHHLKGESSNLKDNVLSFLKESGIEGVHRIELITNASFLGYVFNPVSFFMAYLEDGKRVSIIQVGNTFNEIKPFFVPKSCFKEKGYRIVTDKLFYVSPYIGFDSVFDFNFFEDQKNLNIVIHDHKDDELVLTAAMSGVKRELNSKNLLLMTLKHPFNTFFIIFLIHFHALILFLKGIKYYKKTDNPHLQVGAQIWKK